MKKILIMLLVLILAASITPFIGIGCKAEGAVEKTTVAATEAAEEVAKEDFSGKKVCFVIPTTGAFWIIPMEAKIEKELTEAGVEYIHFDSQFQLETSVSQLEEAIEIEPDVIILHVLDTKAYSPGIKKAYEKGIPVVLTLSEVDEEANKLLTSNVFIDYYVEAEMAAELLVDGMKEKFGDDLSGKKIICQSAPSTDPVAIARQGGFETKLEEIAPEIEILEVQVIDTWQKDESIEKMEAALQKYPQIDGGYGHTDTIAVGLATAADDAGRVGDMVVVGIDGTIDGFTAIEAGIMYGTVLQSPLVTADEVLNVVFKILKGEEVPKLINVPFYKIKLEDLENYVIEDPPRLKE